MVSDIFEALIKGMDARVKVERLRKITKNGPIKIGPMLKCRLEAFEKESIPIRNKIAHNSVIKHPTGDIFYFTDIVRMPFSALGFPGFVGPQADHVSGLRLYEHGLWLNLFSHDIIGALERGTHDGMLEIVRPRSSERTAFPVDPSG